MDAMDVSLSRAGLPFTPSNDDMEEGDPGSDSDFEIDAKKDVSDGFDFSLIRRPAPSLNPGLCPNSTGSETEPQQHRRLRQSHPQPLRPGEEGEHRGAVPPPPAPSPPQAPQRHAPGAGGHHGPVGVPGLWRADPATAGHTAGVAQETGLIEHPRQN